MENKLGQILIVVGIIVAVYFGYMAYQAKRADANWKPSRNEKIYFLGLLGLASGAVMLRAKIVPKVAA